MKLAKGELGHSVLFAARFRECVDRSLFLPQTGLEAGFPRQQRLWSLQPLAAARTRLGFPLFLESVRKCLQDVYGMPSFHRLMADLQTGKVSLIQVSTQTPLCLG
ncbi:hypothetical protein [Bifidobacterium aemilianum]|uniref:hypothetical protein n=1 Tax=Bifidobacterium aemilianum TaxID=2493120 RepID=UPI0013752FA6|nr:hypothetical protein [Bifidobacterium aemilianum]